MRFRSEFTGLLYNIVNNRSDHIEWALATTRWELVGFRGHHCLLATFQLAAGFFVALAHCRCARQA